MVILGLGTFYNIHQMHGQIAPMNTANTNVHQLRKRDRQLIRMLLIQFIFTVVFTLPITIQKIYATFTQNAIKDSYQFAAETRVAQLMRMFAFIDSSTAQVFMCKYISMLFLTVVICEMLTFSK
jgi:hypothetical protein